MDNPDLYLFPIVALLPLTAISLLLQVNPYHALVIRGIMGAVAALVYAVLGAADVALTEALVGTMLAITLYAVAVRSSLLMRLGVLKDEWILVEGHKHQDAEQVKHPDISPDLYHRDSENRPDDEAHPSEPQPAGDRPLHPLGQIANEFRAMLTAHHMRLELVPYGSPADLHRALVEHDVHAVCLSLEPQESHPENPPYTTTTRVQRLYEIMQSELSTAATDMMAIALLDPDRPETHSMSLPINPPSSGSGRSDPDQFNPNQSGSNKPGPNQPGPDHPNPDSSSPDSSDPDTRDANPVNARGT